MGEESGPGAPAGSIPGRLYWQGEVGIESVGALKEELAAAIEAHQEVAVDCSAITAVDLAVLQLLCAAHRTAARRERTLVLSGCREEVFGKVIEAAGFPRRQACPYAPQHNACFWLTTPEAR